MRCYDVRLKFFVLEREMEFIFRDTLIMRSPEFPGKFATVAQFWDNRESADPSDEVALGER